MQCLALNCGPNFRCGRCGDAGVICNAVTNSARGGGGFSVDNYAIGGVSPETVADFATASYRLGGASSTLASVMAFSRTGDAWFRDASALAVAATGVARVGHDVFDGTSLVNGGLLFEEAPSTNLFNRDFSDNTLWVKQFSTWTKNQTGPFGDANEGYRCVDDSGGGSNTVRAYWSANLVASTTYTLSVFMKADQLSFGYLQLNSYTGLSENPTYFNLTTGAVVSSPLGITAAVQPFGSGWFRCRITFTTAADFTGLMLLGASVAGTSTSCPRNGTSSVLFARPMLTATPITRSTTPITFGVTTTRNAEAANINSTPTTTGLSFLAKMRVNRPAGVEATLLDWRADANNRLTVKVNTSNAVILEHVISGTLTTVTGGTLVGGIEETVNVAVRCSPTATNIAVNGTAATAATTTGIPNLAAVELALKGEAVVGQVCIWEGADIGDAGIEDATPD